jgi:predicted AlkP superfamily pyrophosphatase or phosphodiesterase
MSRFTVQRIFRSILFGGSYESGLHSPVNLQASTFTDELKLATNKGAKVYGIGLKEYSSIFSAGHAANGAFWFDNTTGTWMTSTYYMKNLPGWVNEFNAMKHSDTYLNGTWNLLRPVSDYSVCLSDTNNFEAGFDGKNFFPYDLKKMSHKRSGNSLKDYSFLRETPFGNTFTTDFALKLVESEKLGQDEITDFLAICYSSTDYIGHRFGPSSVEMGDAIYRLDKEIETIITYLNDRLGKKNYLVYFTSAHGVSEIPTVMEYSRIPSGYFKQNQALQLLRSYLMQFMEGTGAGIFEKQVFLNRTS